MISVLLPTYNQARFLPDAIAALRLQQTTRRYEVIACNDGSTDATAGILADAGIKTVAHETNMGTAAAINSAAAMMRPETKIVTWVSSDNVMHPSWLEALAREMDEETGAAYSDYQRCEHGTDASSGRVAAPPYERDRLTQSEACYFGPSFMVRREVWPEHRGGTAHDYDAWARTEEACWARGWKLKAVPQVLCDYHRGDWATGQRRPDLYDAPRWRAAAMERRKHQRNWLGDLVAARVRPGDEVLDLGCGIMQATGGRLPCKRHVGVDSFEPYLEVIGPPTIHGDALNVAFDAGVKSFDVVLLLDVIEHLDKDEARTLILAAERIARREVVLFTPDGYVPQHGWNAWGMGDNPAQAHRCGLTFEQLTEWGYSCDRYPNGTIQHGLIMSVFGVKRWNSTAH